jgi:drug/metabolite transporter (DMT)-like permease
MSSKRFAGMILITIGVATASYSNKASAYYGCAAALISSLLFPLRNVLIKKVVSKEDVSINGIQLFFVISFMSSVIGAIRSELFGSLGWNRLLSQCPQVP